MVFARSAEKILNTFIEFAMICSNLFLDVGRAKRGENFKHTYSICDDLFKPFYWCCSREARRKILIHLFSLRWFIQIYLLILFARSAEKKIDIRIQFALIYSKILLMLFARSAEKILDALIVVVAVVVRPLRSLQKVCVLNFGFRRDFQFAMI